MVKVITIVERAKAWKLVASIEYTVISAGVVIVTVAPVVVVSVYCMR